MTYNDLVPTCTKNLHRFKYKSTCEVLYNILNSVQTSSIFTSRQFGLSTVLAMYVVSQIAQENKSILICSPTFERDHIREKALILLNELKIPHRCTKHNIVVNDLGSISDVKFINITANHKGKRYRQVDSTIIIGNEHQHASLSQNISSFIYTVDLNSDMHFINCEHPKGLLEFDFSDIEGYLTHSRYINPESAKPMFIKTQEYYL